MTAAPAGHGKSTLCGRLTADWRDGHSGLQRFDHVYLMVMRNVHNERATLENIICNDLKLLDSSLEGQVRRSLKFQFSLIIIEGYDEILDTEREGSTINQLLTGKHGFRAIVLVSTRPHYRQEIATLAGGSYIYLPLGKLDDQGMNQYCSDFFEGDSQKASITDLIVNSSFISEDLIRIPMFLALTCVMYKTHNLSDIQSTLSSMGSVLATFWCMLMGMKEEKDRKQTMVVIYKSLSDRNMHNDTRRVLRLVAKLSYKCLLNNRYTFSASLLHDWYLTIEDMDKLGPVDIFGDKAEFLHLLFQECVAGYHIASDKNAVQTLLSKKGKTSDIEKWLSPFENALVFSVGMEPSILTEVAKVISIITVREAGSGLCNMDLSYIVRLLDECSSEDIQKTFLDIFIQSNVHSVPNHEPTSTSTQGYLTILKLLGKLKCFQLLKRVYGKHIYSKNHRTVLSLLGKKRSLVISDPFLMACLPGIDLDDTETLEIKKCTLSLLDVTSEWQVSRKICT